MNSAIIISLIVFIIAIISVIVFVIYKKSYKTYTTQLIINLKIKEPAQEATLTKSFIITNPEAETIYTTLQKLGSNIKGEINLENPESRTIKLYAEFKDNLDSYILINSLVDKLKEFNTIEMSYNGNLFADNIKKEYQGKFKENNGMIIVDDLKLDTLYTKEFTDYKIVDSKADNKDFIENNNAQTQNLINDADNPDIQQQTEQNSETQSETQNTQPQDTQNEESETQDTEQQSDIQNTQNEQSEQQSETQDTEQQENFDDNTLSMRIKEEKRDEDFVLFNNQPQMSLHIVLFNMSNSKTISETQKEINYPIFTYSAYKNIKETVNIILEPYKGLISRKTSDNGILNYELHYQSSKTIEGDYKKILEQINKSFDALLLTYTPKDLVFVYQSSDTIKIKRYIKQLEQNNIEIISDDGFKMAMVDKLPSQLFN